MNYLWRYAKYALAGLIAAPVLMFSAIALGAEFIADHGWELLDKLLFGRTERKGW